MPMVNPANGDGPDCGQPPAPGRHWRKRFIAALARSSNLAAATEAAGVSLERAMRSRQAEPDFARAWQDAVAQGYHQLELEVIRRLREGDFTTGDGQKFDFASAIRLLVSQRENSGGHPNRERDVSAAEVRASIDRKIEEIRRRVTRDQAAQGGPG